MVYARFMLTADAHGSCFWRAAGSQLVPAARDDVVEQSLGSPAAPLLNTVLITLCHLGRGVRPGAPSAEHEGQGSVLATAKWVMNVLQWLWLPISAQDHCLSLLQPLID